MHTFGVSTNCLQNINGLAQKLYEELAGQTIHTMCDGLSHKNWSSALYHRTSTILLFHKE